MIRKAALLLCAAPLLASCLTLSEEPARKVAAPADTPAPAAEPAATVRQQAAPDVAAAAPAAPEPSYPDIETLKGEASSRVASLLGQPDFRRTDKPAELWQYRHDACSVDLFLYPGDGGGLTVDYLDVRTFGDGGLSRQACFVAILKARAAEGRS